MQSDFVLTNQSGFKEYAAGLTGPGETNLATAFWTALAERSGDSALIVARIAVKGGIALRLPPQSKTTRIFAAYRSQFELTHWMPALFQP